MPYHELFVYIARKHFLYCPLCEHDDFYFDRSNACHLSMTCQNCSAKWHLNFSRIIYYSNGADARMHVELKKEAVDGGGRALLGKKLETSKWKKMLLKTQRIKSICKYCGVPIKDETDYCKKCGRKILTSI